MENTRYELASCTDELLPQIPLFHRSKKHKLADCLIEKDFIVKLAYLCDD